MKKILFYLTFIILILACSSILNGADWDLWARLIVGKNFFETGYLLNQDIFSYTPTKPLWIDHEWGSGVVFYFLVNKFGDLGVLFLKTLGFFGIIFLMTKIVKIQIKEQNLNIIFYLIVFAAMYTGVGATVRCQLFTFVFFVLYLFLLEKIRRGQNQLLWLFPVIMLLWANLHGGFVAGLGLLIIYGIGEFLNKKQFKKYFLALIPTTLAVFINPYGIKYISYIFEAITMSRKNILEWQSSLTNGEGLIFKVLLIISIACIIINLVKNSFKYSKTDKVKYILLFTTMYLSIAHIKHQALFAISAGCFLYEDFYWLMNIFYKKITKYISEGLIKAFLNIKEVLIYGFIIITGVFIICQNPYQIVLSPKQYPVNSIQFLKENNIKGNLLTVFHWGSYAVWKLYPNCLLAIDGR
ncbi:MAG: hypothetical protein PHV68_03090, partial [Candidatus Gastranaerophilales bacterium]|nr:hypothetical protein [Candidatus Gastranaerophilales bacterium]